MKKVLALTLILALVLLAGCTSKPVETPTSQPEVSAPEVTNEDPNQAAPVVGVTTGLGVVTSQNKLAAATEDSAGNIGFNIIVCAASFAEDGTVLSVSFDAVQPSAKFDTVGALAEANPTEFKTKRELQDEYGMKGASEIGKEWYEQAAAFEQWVTGKTVAEVTGMKTFEKDENHTKVPDEADLKTTVTIDVGEYVEALQKAYDNRH